MITTFDITNIIYLALTDAGFEAEITGEVCKDERRANSDKEDVVINCLPVLNDQVQLATVNVNIYVPDIESKSNNVSQYLPNHKRLSELANKAKEILEEVYSDEYDYSIQQQGTPKEDAIHQHYVNLRIEFKFYNF